MRLLALFAAASFLPVISTPVLGEYPVAGLEPWHRPQTTPQIEWVKREESWYQHALTGIQPPYPSSLYFLDNQGYWHTPFDQPGMTGRYDIRGWHH